jgi:threonine/homoserine/homoserine lactone efflux protein
MELLSENIWVFFGSAILISFTGVITPGPLFAATVAKGYKDKRAGIKIALGHGLVEFPLIALIFFSIGTIFTDPLVKLCIGLVGGAFLLQMGYKMVKSRRVIAAGDEKYFPYDSLWAGAITSSINPYFLLWWATAGAVLVFNAEFFGPIIVVVFAIVHWSLDLAWYTFTSFTVFKTKHLWTPRVHDIVFGICGVIMVAFGVYFIAGTGYELISSL